MNFPATFRGNFNPLSHCSSCCDLRFQPFLSFPIVSRQKRCRISNLQVHRVSRLGSRRRPRIVCGVTETETEPENNNDEEKAHEDGGMPPSTDSTVQNDPQLDSQPLVADQDKDQFGHNAMLNGDNMVNSDNQETEAQGNVQDSENLEVASGSPLPGVKPQVLDESIRIPKETIDILKDQVFGFDTFFVTNQEPYEGGVLFKGNLRGKAAKSYEKITIRMQDRFGDKYKLFLLINPEDDKPVAVVVPRNTLQPETTAVPEWFAAGAFGLVTVFTLFLRNVPALQSNLLSVFDNPNLLMDGLPGALVTALVLGTHEISHILVARSTGIKLGVPYFVPSWQIGSFGAITRILNIVPNREDLLKVAAAGPIAGFSLGLVLLLLGFLLPPSDGIGVVVDASVFHESLLAGGIAKLLLGDVLKEGTPISVNPLVIWAWAGLLINAINSIPAGELDGGRISFAIWGRKASARFTAASIALLGLSSLFNDVAFYWVVLIFFLQRGPIAPLSEEITDPDDKYVALGIVVLLLGLLVCLPYPFPFTNEVTVSF
ncbi:probable zinc metalloprotease EGY2, chloroplastic [Vitis riparia]|uniref:probable zinc metalloprotease EGY2, chloroplastic n=1 Tax=Vitis riparia TaxID=96939 RepID=UPI00155B249E|nr:probable zinc metalloprotease EGY2, chloroplastic [Vitis riparia]